MTKPTTRTNDENAVPGPKGGLRENTKALIEVLVAVFRSEEHTSELSHT